MPTYRQAREIAALRERLNALEGLEGDDYRAATVPALLGHDLFSAERFKAGRRVDGRDGQGVDGRCAPGWVIDAFNGSPAPPAIAEGLLTSHELGPLWQCIPEAGRSRVSKLPEVMEFLLHDGAPAVPWSARLTPKEQAAAARRVARAAAELNAALRDFLPLADVRVGGLWPEHRDSRSLLSDLPIAGHRDCALGRLEATAADWARELQARGPSKLVGRPGRKATEPGREDPATLTALIRQCASIAAGFGPWPRVEDFHAFTAGLCGVMGCPVDLARVKSSLREVDRPPRQRKRKPRP